MFCCKFLLQYDLTDRKITSKAQEVCSMINNYHYFIALAEEMSISKAAKRLFLSHQCLSKYLKNLEQEYGTAFFERSPRLCLTPAGQAYLDMLRQIEHAEKNLESQLDDIRQSKKGVIRFGTTEGRYRILIPSLLSSFKRVYPDVNLYTHYDTSAQLCERIMKNELDIALMNKRNVSMSHLEIEHILDEQLYMVISDHLLSQYFPEEYPDCKERFRHGINLSRCRNIPFILNEPGFNSREMLDSFLRSRDIRLNCILELTQQDLHFMLAAKDYAACFCWAMYIPSIHQSNQIPQNGHLNIFPIKGLKDRNEIVLVRPKGRHLSTYTKELIDMIYRRCEEFSSI